MIRFVVGGMLLFVLNSILSTKMACVLGLLVLVGFGVLPFSSMQSMHIIRVEVDNKFFSEFIITF